MSAWYLSSIEVEVVKAAIAAPWIAAKPSLSCKLMSAPFFINNSIIPASPEKDFSYLLYRTF